MMMRNPVRDLHVFTSAAKSASPNAFTHVPDLEMLPQVSEHRDDVRLLCCCNQRVIHIDQKQDTTKLSFSDKQAHIPRPWLNTQLSQYFSEFLVPGAWCLLQTIE
jgi:hypothetical protein